MEPVRLQVNGTTHHLFVAPHRTLLETLREDLGLTGTKHGCELGECGACTVLVDGRAVNSCLYPAAEVEGATVVTIEGLSGTGGELSAVQRAFIAKGGAQCGFCTPGMVMAAVALLAEHRQPSEEEIRLALVGNLCRCTGYVQIVEAIQEAARTALATGP